MTTARTNLFRALAMLAAAALAASLLMLVVGATTRTAGAQTGAATQVLRDTWEWDGQAWTNLSEELPSAPHVLPGLAMADNPAGGTTLLVGTGVDSGEFETWEFDGNSNTWSQVETAGPVSPSPRPSYAMALDRDRNIVVLFTGGGNSDEAAVEPQVDTWEWDTAAKAWQAKAAGTVAGFAQNSPAMAFWPGRPKGPFPHVVLLVGSTWLWDGTVWLPVLLSFADEPVPRNGHAMATVGQPELVILFGGLSNFNNQVEVLDDTWRWDGSLWTQGLREPPPPPARHSHAMADLRRADPSRSNIVLFGGLDANSKDLNDTWTFDGFSWHLVTHPLNPPARHGHALAFNSARGTVILFGGITEATKPTINITTPADGATYKHKETVNAAYACADEEGGSGLKSCVGDVPDGSPIGTSTKGTKTFTVTAEDNAGNTNSVTHTYSVTASGKPDK